MKGELDMATKLANGRWRARIMYNNQQISVGCYSTKGNAERAENSYKKRLWQRIKDKYGQKN